MFALYLCVRFLNLSVYTESLTNRVYSLDTLAFFKKLSASLKNSNKRVSFLDIFLGALFNIVKSELS